MWPNTTNQCCCGSQLDDCQQSNWDPQPSSEEGVTGDQTGLMTVSGQNSTLRSGIQIINYNSWCQYLLKIITLSRVTEAQTLIWVTTPSHCWSIHQFLLALQPRHEKITSEINTSQHPQKPCSAPSCWTVHRNVARSYLVLPHLPACSSGKIWQEMLACWVNPHPNALQFWSTLECVPDCPRHLPTSCLSLHRHVYLHLFDQKLGQHERWRQCGVSSLRT